MINSFANRFFILLAENILRFSANTSTKACIGGIMKFGLVWCVAALLSWGALFLGGECSAQTTNATVTGQITDQSEKVVPRATVVFTNINTGVPYATQTNGEGIYTLPAVEPGVYRANITKDGFKSIVKPDIEIHVQDQVSINFALQIGSVSETITVEAGGLSINTTDASVSTVVDQSYVQNMPLNGRSFQDLILLTPGIVTQTPQNTSSALGQTGEFSVDGQRAEENYYTVDGVSANIGAATGINMTIYSGATGSLAASTALGTTQALVSVDDLQEFRVQSSTYSAEYGRTPGGQFAFQTKSGSNQWHGTAYEYLRNGTLDANDWFNDYFGLTEPNLQQNDFGGTMGGPVKLPRLYDGKDKTFFFVSYEGLRLAAPQAANITYVPDANLRLSAPQALRPVLNAFPIPNGQDFGDGLAEFIGSWTTPASLDSTSVRFDHLVNEKLRVFFRFSDTASSSTSRAAGGVAPSQKTVSAYTARTYTAGGTSSITNRLSNEFRINYSSNEVSSRSVIDAFGGGTPVDLVQLSGLGAGSSSGAGLIPELSYDNYNSFFSLFPTFGSQRQWNLVDTVSLSLGRHQFKFGADYRRLTPSAVNPNPLFAYFYFSESAVQTNNAFLFAVATAPAYPLYQNFSAFAQDEWKVSARLSLALGLRWEVNPAPGVWQGLKPYAIQGTSIDTFTLAPQGTPLWQTTWFNFAPRLGVAYILRSTPGWETVVRGGGGVFFDTAQQIGAIGFNGPGFSASNQVPSVSFPADVATSTPTIVNPPVKPYGQVVADYPHLQLPYTLQWNASIEQALGTSQALSVSYVGAHGSRLLTSSSTLTPNNPNASGFGLEENGHTSDYDSLQVQLRRKLSHGLTALASYTWSHCIDYGSQNYYVAYQRGNCDFDVRHNVSAAISYDLPNVGHNSLMNLVMHHWGLDDRFTARTGFPITLDGNANFDPATGELFYAGLDLVPGQPIYIYGSQCAAIYNNGLGCPGGRAVNPNAFTDVFSSLNGNAPRNFVRGFGAWQMDLAVRRDFPIYEKLKLQFRVEAFNIFNHPNFGTVNPNFGQSTFGQATATLANSLGVLSPLYQMGGPRSMQFALKLLF